MRRVSWLLLSGAAALVYEIIALVRGKGTISEIVQTWSAAHHGALAAILITVFTGLIALGVHFLSGF